MLRRSLLALFLVSVIAFAAQAADGDGWTSMFDGKSFAGWKASENVDSWKVEDGKLVCFGPRSHLFYVGDEKPFKNFELEVEVMTTPGSNAGIYFHTQYQETGWPRFGQEIQVNITHKDPKKSGGIYAVSDVAAPPAKDNEWYKQYVKVDGRHVISKINGQTVVDYTEPEGKEAFNKDFERRLGTGTFALQAHDPMSKVYFRNLRVRRLP